VLFGVFSFAVLLGAGCGGEGEGDGEATATTISKAAFIKKADAACGKAGKQGEAELKAFLKKHKLGKGDEPNNVELTELGETVLLPLLEQQRDEFRAAGVPRESGDEITSFLNAMDEAIESLKKDPTQVKSSPELLKRVDRLAKEYGFKVCGNR
jgi:hypothetical protein